MKIKNNEDIIFKGVDWWTILIYAILVFLGWISIYAAVYNEEHASIFDMSQKYGAQIMWIGICSLLGITILLVDDKYFHFFSYPSYIFMLLVLVVVIFLGTEVNSAKSWLVIGPMRVQPAEFAKVTTALALAKFMNDYNFDIKNGKNLFKIGLIIGTPAILIYLQNDTGSALVYSAFMFMLYREGLYRWIYVITFIFIAIFIGSFVLDDTFLLLVMFMACLAYEAMSSSSYINMIKYFSLTMFLWIINSIITYIVAGDVNTYLTLLSAFIMTIPLVIYYIVRYQRKETILILLAFIGIIILSLSVDYVFDNMLQYHQQRRILDTLGLENDIKGAGYNVHQSKIAIGSGGLLGKGFLQGTQTKFDFVPEQSTDFIFCTVGEEWGLIGSSIVVILFAILIFRLMKMGNMQHEPFGRIYCYSAASIFLFHVIINIGMTLGLLPVIGIPLPFFSYGGSSLIAFTILLFIALRIDRKRGEVSQF